MADKNILLDLLLVLARLITSPFLLLLADLLVITIALPITQKRDRTLKFLPIKLLIDWIGNVD
ncbi:hypothetical protein [Cylindrospermum sp. FACHB-282]|uniref:hypothetical protein n=1 Tax=Cylindrospermum sp. FACHB-282 TaxID=2692794 RepID=UPI0016869641|nr:hypothetical protein [Cylindrospermum sp. FACHB-282]MBD2388450.1 hypothetical protein [Cylindrospermum sp. FACHB-282]